MRIVFATFEYINQPDGVPFRVARGWPCVDQADGELIVRRHGVKTGALAASCVVEEVSDEEMQQVAAHANSQASLTSTPR